MNIGETIREDLKSRGITAGKLALMLGCRRSNVYNIFQRKSLETDLLKEISRAVGRNYLLEMGREIDKEIKEIVKRRRMIQKMTKGK